jgi:phenylacetate-CoA ligase
MFALCHEDKYTSYDRLKWTIAHNQRMANLLKLYYRLPASFRGLAASGYGYYLRSWRYGRETDRLVEEALRREQWSAQQWKTWQDDQLARLLERAATKVPYYRNLWAERRRRGDRSSWDCLSNWPVLEKQSVRENLSTLVAEDCNIKRMLSASTSGTTGTPLRLWFSRATLRAHYALFEARCRVWYGVSRHDRWAILGTQIVVPAQTGRPPYWIWNAGLNQLYLSLYHVSESTIPFYLDAIKKYRAVYICSLPSAIYRLARHAIQSGRRDVKLKVVIANAEPLYDYQRRAIREAFDCPVRESYGMGEICAAASECEHGRLHLWPSQGVVEVLEGDRPLAPGQSGDLVCTGLVNTDMPLVRYRVGDRGVLSAGEQACPCGRTLPLFSSVDGRNTDVIYTPDGRFITKFEPVFISELPIREAQVVQEALDRIRVRYVPAAGFSEKHKQLLIERMSQRVSGMEIIPEAVEEIPRTAAGKFRLMVCNLPAEQRAALERGDREAIVVR